MKGIIGWTKEKSRVSEGKMKAKSLMSEGKIRPDEGKKASVEEKTTKGRLERIKKNNAKGQKQKDPE